LRDRRTLLVWTRDGEDFARARVEELDDDALTRPSRLPGWSRAHVVTHLARNADALVNLLTWARIGVETPMYASLEAREHAIEAGARRAGPELRADLDASVRRLEDAVASMPEDAWANEVRTRKGRAIPASDVLWLRIREVWVHAVDLGGSASFADIPRAVATALVDEAAATMGADPAAPAVELVATDGAETWHLGGPAGASRVSGSLGDLMAWLLGRNDGSGVVAEGGRLPDLPAWM
jgi:maleylpyruvate isomerase